MLRILSGDADLRTTPIDSALSRSRAQLYIGVPRDSFGDRLVAVNFSDYQLIFEIPGMQDFAAKFPTDAAGQLRSGAELKRWYWEELSAFTVAHNKWTMSGQNDPDSLSKFVPISLFGC